MSREKGPSAEYSFALAITGALASDGERQFASDGSTLHHWEGLYWQPLSVETVEKQAWDWLVTHQPDKATPSCASSCAAAALRLPDSPIASRSHRQEPCGRQTAKPVYPYLKNQEPKPSVRASTPDFYEN